MINIPMTKALMDAQSVEQYEQAHSAFENVLETYRKTDFRVGGSSEQDAELIAEIYAIRISRLANDSEKPDFATALSEFCAPIIELARHNPAYGQAVMLGSVRATPNLTKEKAAHVIGEFEKISQAIIEGSNQRKFQPTDPAP